MLIRLNLQNGLIRRAGFAAAFLISAMLAVVILHEFAAATLSDQRIAVNQDLLNSAAAYFPASGRISARLAEFESMPFNNDFESAEQHLQQAIKLSPNNYRYRLALAEIRDLHGDLTGTEQAFSEAMRLAPNYSEVHWKFANFLVKENRIEDSLAHFRIASVANPNVFGAALYLVAAVSNDNILFLDEIVKDDPRGQLKLALLLANRSRFAEASEIFSKIDRNIRLSASETPAFLDALINKGFSQSAFQHWSQLKNGDEKNLNNSLIRNGDFENNLAGQNNRRRVICRHRIYGTRARRGRSVVGRGFSTADSFPRAFMGN